MTGIGAERSDGGVVCVEAVWFRGEAVEVVELEQGTGRHWAKEILLRRRTSTSSPWVSPCYWPSRWCCTSRRTWDGGGASGSRPSACSSPSCCFWSGTRSTCCSSSPVHADHEGRRRSVQVAMRRGATKVAGSLIGSDGGVRIFTHKRGQFANY